MLAFVNISPLDKGISVSKYVARIIKLIDESGIKYTLSPMGTTIEGKTDEVFDLIKLCHNRMKEFSDRVVTSILIDDRKAPLDRMEHKLLAIKQQLSSEFR